MDDPKTNGQDDVDQKDVQDEEVSLEQLGEEEEKEQDDSTDVGAPVGSDVHPGVDEGTE